MTRPGVTYFEVETAAQEIIASGLEPTIERIRAKLKTGSNSTIGTHLRVFRTKQDPLQQLATKEKIPEELIGLLKGLWERVILQAETKVDSIKSESANELEKNKQTITQVQKDNAQLFQSVDRLKNDRDALTQEKLALEQIIHKSASEIAAINARSDGLLQQLTDKQARVDELHKQNQQTQANLEHYRAASLEQRQQELQRFENQTQVLSQTMQQLKCENDALKQQNNQLQQLQHELQSAQKSMQDKLEKITKKHESVSEELTIANNAMVQKTESQQHWKSQFEKIDASREEQSKIMVDLQTQNSVLNLQLATLQKELINASQQNKILAHDKWLLGQEKAQLFGQLKQVTSHFVKN
ncbi:MAG: hypothetical protein A3F11_10275 [Gammaproteobacteria bacterium RIFCSPHIGHO2_12_FULL_37_14]|nr:MAG: hypothetical protein A3F11_10275 [Gammaproteobacteria bacterium RIFCSPHIGHO2_12_FULL_37_14]